MTQHVARMVLWANYLNSNVAWKEGLNRAFDKVGFDDAFLKFCESRKNYPLRVKGVKDHVWGMIEIDPQATWLIDSPLFQRLRGIKQLGFTYLTYPNAQHTRFEHSLGVYHVVCRLFEAFEQTRAADKSDGAVVARDYPAASAEVQKARHAALFHDLGHAAFSHVSESFFDDWREQVAIGPFTIEQFLNEYRRVMRGLGVPGSSDRVLPVGGPEGDITKRFSEVMSTAIVTSDRFRRFYDTCPGRPAGDLGHVTAEIACLILGLPIKDSDRALPQMLSGPFDADKVDYMIRDAQACGISLSIDISRTLFPSGRIRN